MVRGSGSGMGIYGWAGTVNEGGCCIDMSWHSRILGFGALSARVGGVTWLS